VLQPNPTGQQPVTTYPVNLGAGPLLLNGDTDVSRASAGVVDIGNGRAGDASGTFNAGEDQVTGAQIVAAKLSNGVTGSGAVVLASSPTLSGAALSGTFTGNRAFTGAPTMGATQQLLLR
jgi:hypothetical protein